MVEGINEKAKRMPQPKFTQLAQKSEIAFTNNQKMPFASTLNWQWVLGEISQALITGNSIEIIKLLSCDLELTQLSKNAVDDIQHLTRQTIDNIDLSRTIARLEVAKRLKAESDYYQTNTSRDSVINELDYLVTQLQGLGVIGLGAFMVAASLQLALLQEQAKSDSKQWQKLKAKVIDCIAHCSATTPQLFRLTVGQIDKNCHCLQWQTHTKTAVITEYECRYFDGRDIHIFRNTTPAIIVTCNKHRLQMFQTVTDRVNQTAVIPIRTAIKQWRQLAASL